MSELEAVRGLAHGALEALEQSRERIDDLNVYPVPDGDTGTNLTLTARGVVEALDASTAADRQALAREATRAALMSARGNSGVILSQIVRGAADSLADSDDLARAFRAASDEAYAAVRKPVEGTMLTVIRSLAEAAEAAPALEPAELLALLVERGEEAVARTQEQLDVLREAGVVDAGGAGLVELVRGLAAAAAGEEPVARIAPPPRLSLEAVHQEPSRYRYCTTFVVEGEGLDAAALEPELDRLGDSLLVVGDASALKVHVHTDDPGAALSLGTRVGHDRGRRDRRHAPADRRARGAAAGGAARRRVALGRRRRGRRRGQPAAVRGSRRGADRRGRPDDEPVHGRPARSDRRDCRGRGRAAAEQRERRDGRRAGGARPKPCRSCPPIDPRRPRASSLPRSLPETPAGKPVQVVPTESIPAGLAALIAFLGERSAEENAAAMREALAGLVTGEIAIASRDASADGVPVREGEFLALLDGDAVAAGAVSTRWRAR